MPIILSNESVAISNKVYQNKDIFADKNFPMVIWVSQNVSPVGISPQKWHPRKTDATC